MPLLHIMEVLLSNMTFSIAFYFMQNGGLLQLAYLTNAGNYAPVPTRGGKQDDNVSL